MVEESLAVAESAILCFTQLSATRTEAAGSAAGGEGCEGVETMLGEEDGGVRGAAAGGADRLGVASSAAGLGRWA